MKYESYLSISKIVEHSSLIKEVKIEALKSLVKSLLDISLIEVKVAKEREVGRKLTLDDEIELFENEIRRIRQQEDDPQIVI